MTVTICAPPPPGTKEWPTCGDSHGAIVQPAPAPATEGCTGSFTSDGFACPSSGLDSSAQTSAGILWYDVPCSVTQARADLGAAEKSVLCSMPPAPRAVQHTHPAPWIPILAALLVAILILFARMVVARVYLVMLGLARMPTRPYRSRPAEAARANVIAGLREPLLFWRVAVYRSMLRANLAMLRTTGRACKGLARSIARVYPLTVQVPLREGSPPREPRRYPSPPPLCRR